MSENSTRPHSEKGVGPARRPSTRRIGASGLRNKPKWRSMRLKLAAVGGCRIMANLRVLRPEQQAQWMDVLEQSFQYDFYHLPHYHALAEQRGEGRAHLFVYSDGHYLIAVPLLLRSLGEVPGLAHIGEGLWDATSVYGYAGPIASDREVPSAILRNFQVALREILYEQHVVAIFSRLHPLIPQRGLVAGLGERKAMGRTVSMDLTLPVDVQRSRYRKNHKYDINKLRRVGATCLRDKAYLDEFIQAYYETMYRVRASDAYFFERSYFEKLISALNSHIHLFVCLLEDKVICGGLFGLCGDIVQYHLGGTRDEFQKLSPMKLLFDTVRLWANGCEAQVFHLGGGMAAQEDSLFHFKVGFSDRTHEFTIWRWVVAPKIYDQLDKERAWSNQQEGLQPVSAEYFPAYRCPTVQAPLRGF